MMQILKNNTRTETVYMVDNLSYIYQSEFYSLAWGKVHHGFYFLPNGSKYRYREPENWNFYSSAQNQTNTPFKIVWGYETDGVIAPEHLFQNLRNSSLLTGLLGGAIVKPNPINLEAINHLMQAEIVDYGMIATDQGTLSNSILVYDPTISLYKRILLTSNGQRDMVNQSQYAKSTIKVLGETERRLY